MNKAKLSKDAKASSSGGSSSASSFVDLKTSEKRNRDSNQADNATRSRSFLYCLGRHLGRNFSQEKHQQQQQQQRQRQQQQKRCQNMLTVYNSEEDVHSSSTDSFSLSYERCSTHTPSCQMTGSSIDLTGEERSSGASSAASAYSRYSSAVFTSEADDIWSKHARRHFFVETMYRRPVSELGQHSTDEYSNNSQDDDEAQNGDSGPITDNAIEATQNNNEKNETKHSQQQCTNATKLSNANQNKNFNSNSSSKYNNSNTPPSRSRSISPCSITKGLHLSRISITSSVCRMFQHLTTSSSTTTSTRSHSCSSTPLRCSIQQNVKKVNVTDQPKNGSLSKKAALTTSTTSVTASSIKTSKKKEKKQQSILRPPVHYVYMKGMSGLYSRVPRYTVCCPYTTT